MSRMAVSKTRVFDLTAKIFEDVDAKSMQRLIELFAGNLRQVVHGRYRYYEWLSRKQLKSFSKFPCPRLETLDVGAGEIKTDVLRNLLGNSPNLHSLKWTRPQDTFPSGIVCEKLEEVNIRQCTIKFFKSLVQNCPNLKRIVLCAGPWAPLERWEQLLRKIFVTKLELESLKLERVRIDHLGNLWKLTELRSLSLRCHEISDETMIKISKSLHQLESLQLKLSFKYGQKVSSRGISALSDLKDLRTLKWSQNPHGAFNIDRGALRLAECGRLRVVRFSDRLSPTTMRSFVQHCPMLRYLSVWRIEGIGASDAAKEFVESLSGFVQKHLEIRLQCHSRRHRRGHRHIWQSKKVKEAVGRVNATANGRSIWISYYKWGYGDYINIGRSMENRTAETWEEWSEWAEEEGTLQLIFGSDTSIP